MRARPAPRGVRALRIMGRRECRHNLRKQLPRGGAAGAQPSSRLHRRPQVRRASQTIAVRREEFV
jgi:hypothetical protein